MCCLIERSGRLRPRRNHLTSRSRRDGAPDTESIDEIRAYLRDSLHYSAEQTRQRYASYITRRMFPNGHADASMLAFARTFPKSQALRDVCFYRFLEAEPLEVQVVEDLLLLPGRRSSGRIIMFHEMDEGNYTLPTNLIAENHLWEIR